ncbi:MAG: Coenzyme F420 hydrogenase/dehydrogenase, beta subunit C-terminal domain [Nitrospiraceae bacterium]|nr:Coenzyme F420 hydrogenase/dehydrogenase, beta subunit C-terminal domain [Nitrospiraceae bacterium]
MCPSAFLLYGADPGSADEPQEPGDCYLVHCADERVRLDAASGGFITGLILHLMDKGAVDGAIVARCEGETPLIAESFIARNRDAVLSSCGSKYVPVSNCTALREVLQRPGRYIFIGTPCMIEGLTKLQNFMPALKERIVLSVGFVCSGMASRISTKNYIENDGKVSIRDVRRIAYRGDGWPGRFRVFGKNGSLLMDRPYIGGSLVHVVSRDHYLRCENCLDHWAHFSDIVVSDPWTAQMMKNETIGRSAVMVRTRRGKESIESGIRQGGLIADPITAEEMFSFNRHLVIDSRHPRHSWMAIYQLIFFRRMRYLLPLFKYLAVKRTITGLRTTLNAFFDKKYYL